MRMYKKVRVSAMDKLSGSLTRKPSVLGLLPNRGCSGAQVVVGFVDGTLRATGLNTRGQLGIGSKAITSTFVLTSGVVGKVKSIATSEDTVTFVLTEDGALYAAGTSAASTRGSLGDNTLAFSLLTTGVKEIANFNTNTFILKTDNTLWGAGQNSYGQLGASGGKSTFVQVATDVADMALGQYHGILLKLDGTVWVTGTSASSGLGEYTTGSASWRKISSLPAGKVPVSVHANYYSSVVVMEDGTVYGSGNPNNGELGFGHTNKVTAFSLMLGSLPYPARKFSLGRTHSAVLLDNGDLYTCGSNNGGLGLGDTDARSSFVKALSGVSNVGCVASNTFVVTDGGIVLGCGTRMNLGVGNTSGYELTFVPVVIS